MWLIDLRSVHVNTDRDRRAGDEEYGEDEGEVTDDSDDPDAKEVDYDDEYVALPLCAATDEYH